MYVQINVGRNQGQFDMSNEEWNECVNDLRLALAAFAHSSGCYTREELADKCEVHYGSGSWNEVLEESAKISLINETGFDTEGLREYLTAFKGWYKQDHLALIIGSELI